ncbi:hypothetical protein MAH1_25820 [Sessilibacter sp. MAH1]
MFTNKHVVTALIVAPILAVLSYFAVGFWVAEPPQKAESGQSYKLAEKPNCRYTSGMCELKNGDFSVKILPHELPNGGLKLILTSSQALEGAKIALVDNAAESIGIPSDWLAVDSEGMEWEVEINPESHEQQLQLVFAAENESLFFGETKLTFIDYQTTFNRDFRRLEE